MSVPTVFLSAATDDLKTWRDRLYNALQKECQVFVQGNLAAPPSDVLHQLRRHIDQSEFVIHLAGLAYGAEPGEPAFPERPDFRCSYSQFEYYYAHQRQRKVIAVVLGEEFPFTPFTEKGVDPADQELRRQLQLAHRQRVTKGSFVGTPLEGTKNRPLSEQIADVGELFSLPTSILQSIRMEKSRQQELVQAFNPAVPTSLAYSFPGESLLSRTKAVPVLCEIDRLAYQSSDVSFDEHEITDLLERFPKAIMIQTDHGKPTGYVSGFPISPEVAARLDKEPAPGDYAVPCTSHDRDLALFLTSEVLTEEDASRLPEVVWYFDSIAVVSAQELASPLGRHTDTERASALLREAIKQFKTWTKTMKISRVVTVTVSVAGEGLLKRKGPIGQNTLKGLKRVGFGKFQELWRDKKKGYACWQVRKISTTGTDAS
jgi:hypothetical protein